MGIHGLKTFVDKNFNGWDHKKVKGTLVLDGNNVMFDLCDKKSWCHGGGQYGKFRKTTLDFIYCLKQSGISPVFVFDGIDKQEKFTVKRDRHTKLIVKIGETFTNSEGLVNEVLPLLSKEVFQDALKEREIPFYYVDGEGDPDIVALANHYQCPVVSNDADFFMFNVEGGCIPMSRFHWRREPIEADFYYLSKFIEDFKLYPELYLVIPAIAGNDIITATAYTALKEDMWKKYRYRWQLAGKRKVSTVELSVRYLANFKSLDNLWKHISDLQPDGAECRRHLEDNYDLAKKFYLITGTLSTDDLMSDTNTKLRCFDGTQLPEWVLGQYRNGYFMSSLIESLVLHKCLLRIVPDDPELETAHACSHPIRQAIYGILVQPTKSLSVEETFRKGSQLVSKPVLLDKDLQLPSIHSIGSRSDKFKNRRYILYDILGCNVDHLEHKWQLVAAASCFWVRETRPLLEHIQALILTFLHCSTVTGQYSPPSSHQHEERKSPQWMAAFHCYAQWQCVYLDAFKLNNTLMNPLLYESPAFLFDGEMVMHYVFRSDLSSIVQKEVDKLKKIKKKVLCDHLKSAILPSQSSKPLPELMSNPFALLTTEESESTDPDD